MEKMEFESKMYALHEMRDELESAINNLNVVMSQEDELFDILNKDYEQGYLRKHDWNKFKEGLSESKKNYTMQLERMTNKLNYISILIDLYTTTSTEEEKKMSEMVDMIVSYILIVLS